MSKINRLIYKIFSLFTIMILICILVYTVKLIKDNKNVLGMSEKHLIEDVNNEVEDSSANNESIVSNSEAKTSDDNNMTQNPNLKDITEEQTDNSDKVSQNRDANNSGEKDSSLNRNNAVKVSASSKDKEDPQHESSKGMEMDVREIEKSKHETDEITFGIDVSKWQGVIDWKKVKEAGVEFAIIRVGYRTQVDGKIIEDPYAEYNLQQAQKHGIKLGAYFFSTAINKKEAIEEAKWVADFIAPYKITYPVVYNCEGFTDPENRQYGLTKEERTHLVTIFLDYIKKSGYTPMFYAAKGELEGSRDWDTDLLTKKYKIWVAHYPDQINLENPKSTYSGAHDMWQYTSNGNVPGIKGPVDLNVAYFGYKKEANAKDDKPVKEVTADPVALVNFKEVNEKVTAKEVTNLRNIPSLENDSKVIEVLHYGETATRTGIGDNGWSRVEYKGKTLYAITSYLTTDLKYKEKSKPTIDNPEAGITFKEVNDKVTAKIKTNLRLIPSAESDDTIVTSIVNGDVVIRTGIGSNGWSRVEYEGQTLYAVTNYLEVVTEE